MSTCASRLSFNSDVDDYEALASDVSVENRANLLCSFGGSASNILLDPNCLLYQSAGIKGAIGFKRFGRYAVALGDPVCEPQNAPALVDSFRLACSKNGLKCIVAVCSDEVASLVHAQGGGVVKFGVDQIVDPSSCLSGNTYCRDLRKKLKRARRAGVIVSEYRPDVAYDANLEEQMNVIVGRWLGQRSGPQVYWAGIDLFTARPVKRWFCGTVEGKPVCLLSTLRLDAHEGYMLEHIICPREVPVGTSELLITQTLEALGRESCTYATFGPAPGHDVQLIGNFTHLTDLVTRGIYRLSCRLFKLDAKALFRQKFRPTTVKPLYLAFYSPQIEASAIWALLRAFNLSPPQRWHISGRSEPERDAIIETEFWQ